MEHWQIVAILGSLISVGIAIFVFLNRATERGEDRGFSIREHAEYKEGVSKELVKLYTGQQARLTIKDFDDWRDQFRHDMDRVEGILHDMHNDLMQRVESREMVQTAQAKHDELQRAIHRLQVQLDTLQQRINGKE